MPLEQIARNCWVSLATAAACCLLSGCGGSDEDPIMAHSADADLLVQRLAGEGASGGTATAAALPDPVGFATLRGNFKVAGSFSSFGDLDTEGKDRAYCGAVPDDRVVMDSEKNLQNVLVFLSMKLPAAEEQRYGTWIHEAYRATESAVLEGAAAFDQEKCRFKSRIFPMRSTQSVQILNSDTVGHNTSVAGARGVKSINLSIGASASMVYAPGGAAKKPFAVSCAVHPWMSSYMISLDHPYFAVTEKDGSFEIPNLPAGVELTFSLWHEQTKFFREVEVKVVEPQAVATKTDKRGKFKMTLSADQDAKIAVELDASLLK